MKTTLFTTLMIIVISFCMPLMAQSDKCPTKNKMKEGSCIMIEYPTEADAIKAVTAPAETMVVSGTTDGDSDGVYIAQYNCFGKEVVYTKAGPCNCTEYDGAVIGSFKFTHADMTCTFDAAGVLPVEFKAFTARKDGALARLSWTTAFESDNEGFYVEKSADGEFFQEFSFIVGEGNSTVDVSYEALDRDPVPGVNYYRLKQVDYNGNERYSEVVKIDFRNSISTVVSFDSASEELQIISEKKIQTVEIFDMSGVRIHKGSLQSGQSGISLAGYQSGHFVAVISFGNGSVETKKFTKL